MQKKTKRAILLLAGILVMTGLISLVFPFGGFSADGERFGDERIGTEERKKKVSGNDASSGDTIINVPTVEGDRKISAKKINIYILDAKNKTTVPIASVVETSAFTPRGVADEVLLALGEKAAGAKIGEVREDGEGITVDLLAESAKTPFGEISAKMEELILNSISYSIFDNFPEYGKIYFTVNGEAYNSNKIKISENKPFINK